MEEFSQDIKIEVDILDIASIRDGLHRYANLLTNDGAFKGTRSKLLNVEFVHTKSNFRSLQLSDTPQLALLQDAFSIAENGYIKTGTVIDENSFYHVSESILFSIALDKPELKDDLINLALEMVAYSRRHNNTLHMWADDIQVFGLESLYMLARIYPECSYFIGAFLVPNWDDEKAPYSVQYLTHLLRKHGWNQDLIKAYLYCDNFILRQRICLEWDKPVYESLGSYLQDNPIDYDYFKSALIDRFKDQYCLPDSHVENVVFGFYESLDSLVPSNLQSFFDDAKLLQESIENELGSLLVFSEKTLDFNNEEYDPDETEDAVRRFFIDGFSQGEKIWAYIELGEPLSIIRRIHPVEIITLANTKGLAIAQWFKRVECSEEEVNEYLDSLFYPYFNLQLQDFDEIGASFVRQQQLLRFLDVIKRVFGVDSLDIHIRKLIVNKYKMLTDEDYNLRFNMPSILSKNEIRQRLAIEITKLADYFSEDYWANIGFSELSRLYQLVLQDRRALLDVDWKEGGKGFYCLAAYILQQDLVSEHKDQVTYKLFDVLNVGLFDPVVSHIQRNLAISSNSDHGMTEKQFELISDYLLGKRFQGRKEADSYKIVLTLMRRYLLTCKSSISHAQPRYRIFESSELQSIVLIAFLVLSGESKNGLVGRLKPYLRTPLSETLKNRVELKQNLQRILKLFVDLAPQKVIHQIAYIRPDFDIFENTAEDEVFFSRLEKLRFNKSDLLSCQVSLSQASNGPGYRYLQHLFHYVDSESTLYKSSIRKAKSLACGLEKAPEAIRVQFYHDMTLQYPDFGFRKMNEFHSFFEDFINDYIALSCDDEFLNDLKKNIVSYVKGDLDFELIKSLFDEISLVDIDNTPWIARMSLYFWKISEPVRKRLATVLSYLGDQGYQVAYAYYQRDVDRSCSSDEAEDAVLDYFYALNPPMTFFSQHCMSIENNKYIELFMTDERILGEAH